MAVVFFHVQKVKRGYYNLNIELLFDHTEGLSEEVITEKTRQETRRDNQRKNPNIGSGAIAAGSTKKPVEND